MIRPLFFVAGARAGWVSLHKTTKAGGGRQNGGIGWGGRWRAVRVSLHKKEPVPTSNERVGTTNPLIFLEIIRLSLPYLHILGNRRLYIRNHIINLLGS